MPRTICLRLVNAGHNNCQQDHLTAISADGSSPLAVLVDLECYNTPTSLNHQLFQWLPSLVWNTCSPTGTVNSPEHSTCTICIALLQKMQSHLNVHWLVELRTPLVGQSSQSKSQDGHNTGTQRVSAQELYLGKDLNPVLNFLANCSRVSESLRTSTSNLKF